MSGSWLGVQEITFVCRRGPAGGGTRETERFNEAHVIRVRSDGSCRRRARYMPASIHITRRLFSVYFVVATANHLLRSNCPMRTSKDETRSHFSTILMYCIRESILRAHAKVVTGFRVRSPSSQWEVSHLAGLSLGARPASSLARGMWRTPGSVVRPMLLMEARGSIKRSTVSTNTMTQSRMTRRRFGTSRQSIQTWRFGSFL